MTGSFVDYLIPSAADLPSFTTGRTETPALTNALGVKGVGEAGTIASTPAIVNGVLDAIRQFGVTDILMPALAEPGLEGAPKRPKRRKAQSFQQSIIVRSSPRPTGDL